MSRAPTSLGKNVNAGPSLDPGVIAGIVIGVVLAIGIITAAVIYFMYVSLPFVGDSLLLIT